MILSTNLVYFWRHFFGILSFDFVNKYFQDICLKLCYFLLNDKNISNWCGIVSHQPILMVRHTAPAEIIGAAKAAPVSTPMRYDPTFVDLTSNFFFLCTNVKNYLYNVS